MGVVRQELPWPRRRRPVCRGWLRCWDGGLFRCAGSRSPGLRHRAQLAPTYRVEIPARPPRGQGLRTRTARIRRGRRGPRRRRPGQERVPTTFVRKYTPRAQRKPPGGSRAGRRARVEGAGPGRPHRDGNGDARGLGRCHLPGRRGAAGSGMAHVGWHADAAYGPRGWPVRRFPGPGTMSDTA